MEAKQDEEKKLVKPNPAVSANSLSLLFFWWLNPIFALGYKKVLDTDDLFDVHPDDEARHLADRLEKEWKKELGKDKPGLGKAIIRTFWKEFALVGVIAFFEECIRVLQPILLGILIGYFTPNSTMPTWTAYALASGVTACSFILTLTHHPYFFGVQRIGMWTRVSASALIYRKALRLGQRAFVETTTGHIVNLLSNDVVRFDYAPMFLHYLWIGPLESLVVLGYLYYLIGPTSLASFGVLLLLMPVQGSMGKLFTKLRLRTAVQTDERVRLMNEMLSGMKVIKLQCWEKLFTKLITDVRKKEIQCIRTAAYARAAILAPFFASAKVIVFATVLAFVLTGGKVQADQIFVLIALYNPTRLLMHLFVPNAIQLLAESKITCQRIKKFLLLPEYDKSSHVIHPERPLDLKSCGVTVLNLTASWDKEGQEHPTLNNISLAVKPGELLAIIGPVGAGKSSLLYALLGEMTVTAGTARVAGSIAYTSQDPWLFSASVRQNVLFGRPYDPKRYRWAVRCSALAKDIKSWECGDQTMVGEHGVMLSGGQKARLSLARAVYTDADCYLLDDPLSAVDTEVAEHLFDKCIQVELKSKVCLLVTHQIQFVKAATRILILKEGSVTTQGTYNEIVHSGIDLYSLLQTDSHTHPAVEEVKASEMVTVPLYTEIEPGSFTTFSTLEDKGHIHSPPPASLPLIKSLGEFEATDSAARKPDIVKSLDVDIFKSLDVDIVKSLDDLTVENEALLGLDESDNQVSKVKANGTGSKQSLGSKSNVDEKKPDAPGAVEVAAQGSVRWKVYLQYMYHGGGVLGIILIVITNVLAQTAFVASDWWLSYWSNAEEMESLSYENNSTSNYTKPLTEHQYLYVYAGITIAVFVFGLVRALLIFSVLVSAASSIHNLMFVAVLRSPMTFFDIVPIGRILNRFSNDMGLVDDTLPLTMFDYLQCLLMVIGYVLVAGIFNYWVFIPTVPLIGLFIYIRRYYLCTSRSVKRIESATRSPVYSHVSASIKGLYTIRAYGSQQRFLEQYYVHQNKHTVAWFLFLATSRWFAIRLDALCVLFVAAVSFCSVAARSSLTGGEVGLMLTYAIGLMGLFQWAVRQSAEVENQMIAVERLLEYTELPSEAALDSANPPPPSWPTQGTLQATGVSLAYAKDGPFVLKNLNFNINDREKIGICGRTGAGKSSLISLLFRLVEPSGRIYIDKICINDIGLHELRSVLAIIPQDPVLFKGSVRQNLDPYSEHTDSGLWNSLEAVHLKKLIEGLGQGLESELTEGGQNMSTGQRQLFCLARALLRNNRIIVMDEATANVDHRTDHLIQETIRTQFAHCTLLVIAHRLHTILDCDRIMVLSDGEIVEFDEPYILLQRQGILYQLVQHTGDQVSLTDKCHQIYILKHGNEPLYQRDE